MAIKPILFNTPMTQRTDDGTKTETRRNPFQVPAGYEYKGLYMVEYGKAKRLCAVFHHKDGTDINIPAPYLPGDVLWGRETWAKTYINDGTTHPTEFRYEYKASYEQRTVYRWRPSIHMPKEAARLFLRVKDVRVERLQDITEDGALAEGVPGDWPMEAVYCPMCKGEGLIGAVHPVSLGYMEVDCPHCEKAIDRFLHLWDTTIKPADLQRYGWNANPWVWVIEFERCEKPAGWPGEAEEGGK